MTVSACVPESFRSRLKVFCVTKLVCGRLRRDLFQAAIPLNVRERVALFFRLCLDQDCHLPPSGVSSLPVWRARQPIIWPL
jgi:hypothetical protein